MIEKAHLVMSFAKMSILSSAREGNRPEYGIIQDRLGAGLDVKGVCTHMDTLSTHSQLPVTAVAHVLGTRTACISNV